MLISIQDLWTVQPMLDIAGDITAHSQWEAADVICSTDEAKWILYGSVDTWRNPTAGLQGHVSKMSKPEASGKIWRMRFISTTCTILITAFWKRNWYCKAG